MSIIRCRAYWIAAAFLLPLSASAEGPRYADIMPVSHIRAGMKGYGLTVFRGTKIERFDVTVVGVVKRGSLLVPGHDMILVKMAGGPMTTRQANLIRGMSGSPVYINGKIIGAFSMGEPTTKEPLGGVTPIEDMLEAWDPKLPKTPLANLPDLSTRTLSLNQPIITDTRRIEQVVFNAPRSMRSHGTTLALQPCTSFAAVTSNSKTAREKLARLLAPYNVEVTQGVATGRKPDFKGSPLVPGAAFSMMLATGDLAMGATGTVSYRKGSRILGFGHPFMGIGPIEAPLTSAYIYDIYPLLSGSYKISSPGPIVGSSTQDRNFAISGVMGQAPKLIPVKVDVKDASTGRARVFRSQTVTHPNLFATLVSAAVSSAVEEIRSTPGPAMARVVTTVDAEEVGQVSRSNIVFSSTGIDGAVTMDLDDLLSILTSNPFYPLGIKSAEVRVEIESGRQTAQVERIYLKEGRFEPGENAEIGIVIKPYKQPSILKTVHLTIPANTPTGRYVLQVRGGAVPAPINLGGFIIRQGTPQNQEQAPPASIRQMVERYDEREKNNEIVARLILPTTAVNVEGQRLSNLPPSLDALMRSAKSSGVRMERDEVRVIEPTDWVISGQQLLTINVQRRDTQEAPTGTAPATPSSPPITPTAQPNATTVYTESDDEESVRFAVPRHAAGVVQGKRATPGDEDEEDDTAAPESPPANTGKSSPDKKPAVPSPTTATTSAAVPPPAEEKPVGRAPQVWRQTSRADFARGTANGVSVTTAGDLRLTRTLKRLQSSTESFIWSLAPDGKGGLFAGTGTQGRILRVDASGSLSVFADLPDLSIHALLTAPDGALWAATGPEGRTYRITPDGKFTEAFKAPEKYALALARDSKGNIFIGTGGGKGNIYRIAPDGKAGLYIHTAEEHVLALATDAADNLYAGTSSAGILYRITPDGTATALFDAPEQSITCLDVNSKGEIFAATAPRGVLYRITPDGAAKTVYDRAASAYTALRTGPDDTLFAAAGGAVFAVRPDDTLAPLDNREDIDILALAVAPDGTLYAGTGNAGEIWSAAPASTVRTGTYESVIHDAKQVSRWGAIRWTASVPPGTHLRVQTRSGNVSEPDDTWSAWTTPQPLADGARIASPPARFAQYRVIFESDTAGVSPMLRDISVTYLPKNQPPKIAFQSPTGGERWARRQTVRWQATDPDQDTLTYDLFYSPDNGATWKPMPAAPATTTPPSPPAPAAPSNGTTTKPAAPQMDQVTAELDRHPDMPAALREAILARTRQSGSDSPGATTGDKTPAPPSTPSRDTSRAIETKGLPDGVYLLKVIASDRTSNPTDALTSETVSEPFFVSNTPPSLYVVKSMLQVRPDHSVALEGAATQTLIAVTAVQYRVDNGEWTAAIPADGIFDSGMESFTLATSSLAPGAHTIEVKAFNAAGSTATEKVAVEVK